MKAKAFLLVALAAALALLAAGCDLVHQDEVELAKAIMRSIEGSSPAESEKSIGSKAALFNPPPGLTIFLVDFDPLSPPTDGDWIFSLQAEFDGFVPPGHEQSSVTGVVDAVLAISYIKGNPMSLTVSVDGELEVSGENAGTYVFDATLRYEFGSGEYTYSGTIQIDDYTYTFKS
jgi:hypothetical protein